MSWSWGNAIKGAGQGAAMGAGNPVTMALMALGKGALSGFTGSPDSEASGEGETDNGFGAGTILDAIKGLLGGGSDESQSKVVNRGGGGGGGDAYMPPQLMGFPSLTRPSVTDLLAKQIASRRAL